MHCARSTEVIPLGMTKSGEKLRAITIKLPVATLQKIRGNRSRFIREAVVDRLARAEAVGVWRPRTPVGRRLQSLRAKASQQGDQLLDAEAINAEIRSRRGGLS